MPKAVSEVLSLQKGRDTDHTNVNARTQEARMELRAAGAEGKVRELELQIKIADVHRKEAAAAEVCARAHECKCWCPGCCT